MKPLAIDLYCGLGGWAEGFLAEGYDVIGFDIERHDYGAGGRRRRGERTRWRDGSAPRMEYITTAGPRFWRRMGCFCGRRTNMEQQDGFIFDAALPDDFKPAVAPVQKQAAVVPEPAPRPVTVISAPPSPILLNTVTQGDCLDLLPRVASASVDMVLCDLPYGVTHNKWDSLIDLPALWLQYGRILKANAVVVLTATQPFSSLLVMANLPWFQYSGVWAKNIATGHLDSKRRPMRKHEDILVFSGTSYQNPASRYFPQMTMGEPYTMKRRGRKDAGSNYGTTKERKDTSSPDGARYPTSILAFDREVGLHPTQKPVALWEYLIRTYTNEGDTVLDNCCGSGTTGVACVNTGRNFIQMELSPEYCEIARDRLMAFQRTSEIIPGVDAQKKLSR